MHMYTSAGHSFEYVHTVAQAFAYNKYTKSYISMIQLILEHLLLLFGHLQIILIELRENRQDMYAWL